MLWSKRACRTFRLGIVPVGREGPRSPPDLADRGADSRAERRGLRLPGVRPEATMLQSLKEQFTTMIAAGAFEPVRRHLSVVEQDDRMAEAVG